MGLASIVDRITAHAWTGAEVTSIVGDVRQAYVAHAVDTDVRETARSSDAISALLASELESGRIDGALVCVTAIEEGRVRARYRIARERDDVLVACGSTHVRGDFAHEAMRLLRDFDGRLAVVGLPCEIAQVTADASLADKVALTVSLFCSNTIDTTIMDQLIDRLSKQAGGSPLVNFALGTGPQRGQLVAEFANGTVIEKPSSYYELYHNLAYGTPKKCIFCGDHFGYSADVSAGALRSQGHKNDPIKHTALITKNGKGEAALQAAVASGHLSATPVPIGEILDSQRRTAPFHYNVSARSIVGESMGLRIPDPVNTTVRWNDRAAARIVLSNHLASADAAGCEKVLSKNRRLLKLKLYVLKGLQSLPTGPLAPKASAESPRFSLIAATVSGNRGAEAMLETSIGRIRDRHPDACFSVFSYYPEKDAALIADRMVSVCSSTPAHLVLVLFPMSLLAAPFAKLTGRAPRFFPRSVRELAESKALIDLAGVSFIDGREKFLPFNILTILPAMLLGTPVFKLAQAMGPFEHALNRFSARLLRRCALVVPRGDVTLEHMRTIAFPADKMLPCPDVAFLFESRDALSHEGMGEAGELATRAGIMRGGGREVVGLCPSAVLAGKASAEGWDYIGFMAELAEGLIGEGHAVLLFPNATRAGSEKLRNNDLPVIREIVGRLGGEETEGLLAVKGDMNAAALRVVLQGCSCAAVSRFHAMVGALSIGLPVAVVGWSHKYLEVMKQFGLEEFVFDYSAHDADALRVVVDRLLADRESHSTNISKALPRVQDASRSQFEEMFRRLGQ